MKGPLGGFSSITLQIIPIHTTNASYVPESHDNHMTKCEGKDEGEDHVFIQRDVRGRSGDVDTIKFH